MRFGRNSTGGQSGRLYDSSSRFRKARKIATILETELESGLRNRVGLDVGCGNGAIAHYFKSCSKAFFGIDSAHEFIGKFDTKDAFLLGGDGVELPFKDEAFDVVICAQVYEHAADAPGLVSEIRRVLKRDGVVFFSGPNKYSVIEDHYGLPFLSWFPRSLSSVIVRIFGKGQSYDESPKSLKELETLWKYFEIKDITHQIIANPTKFGLDREVRGMRWTSRIPVAILVALRPLYPNYNWILRKRLQNAGVDS